MDCRADGGWAGRPPLLPHSAARPLVFCTRQRVKPVGRLSRHRGARSTPAGRRHPLFHHS